MDGKTSQQDLKQLYKTSMDNIPVENNDDHLTLKRKSSCWGSINGQISAWPRINIYISKRPFEDDLLIAGFKYVLGFLLNHKELEYHVYLEDILKNHSVVVSMHDSGRLHYFHDTIEKAHDIHYVLTLGGDGTILWAHKMFPKLSLPPFLCFNGGTLCFLSNFHITETENVMNFFHNRILSKGQFNYKMYPRLTSFVCGSDKCEVVKGYVLNDIVIERSTPSIVYLDVFINDCLAVSVKSDGLLISSSTGSTAYNLSLANGVIMHSDVESIIINPMASMSLSSRPIIVPKTAKVKISINPESRHNSRLVYDGLTTYGFNKGDSLTVECCAEGLSMILEDDHNETKSWISKLKELRGWK